MQWKPFYCLEEQSAQELPPAWFAWSSACSLTHFIHHSLIAANWARTFEWSARNYYSAFRDGAALLYILFSCTSFHFIVVVVVVKQSTLASFYAYARLHWRNFNFLDFWVCEFASSSSSLVHSLRLWSLLLYVGHQCKCVIYFFATLCFVFITCSSQLVVLVCVCFILLQLQQHSLALFHFTTHTHFCMTYCLSLAAGCCCCTSTRNVV